MAPGAFGRDSLFHCKDMVAVVTGGGTGIGLVAAQAFSQNGARVYILGRRLEKLEEAAAACSGNPGKVIPLQCDTTSKPSLEAAASKIEAEIGYVNLLFANAGVNGPRPAELREKKNLSVQETQNLLWNIPMDDFMDTFKVNVAGTSFTAIAFMDLLDKGNKKGNLKQSSQVLITSSLAGFNRNFVNTGLPYNTSKAATNHLVKCLSSVFTKYKIRVNCIAPGIFPSEMTETALGMKPEEMVSEDKFAPELIPLGRAGRDEEMAGTLLYMASEAGAYNAGVVHIMDGGRIGVQPGASY